MAESVLLAGSVIAAALLSTEEQWHPLDLVGLLAVVVVGSDSSLRAKRFRISGSFLGLVLAMALLGPAPAVAMGLACASVDAVVGASAARCSSAISPRTHSSRCSAESS